MLFLIIDFRCFGFCLVVSFFVCLIGWGLDLVFLFFFNTDKSYSVQKEKKNQYLSHTVKLTHTKYYFMDSGNLTDSVWDRVASLLKKGYIQH